jgi:Fic family protein
MIYRTPELTELDRVVIGEIDLLRDRLRYQLRQPRRWFGTLRRATVARAAQGSNSIEGYHATVEDVAAVLDDEEPLDADTETRHAIAGYRDAMTYVLQLAGSDPPVRLDSSLLLSLHFMMIKHELPKGPGRWRPGAVWVEDADGSVTYEAPPRDGLEQLVEEMLAMIDEPADVPLVQAAMAHLNLALIHPFSDGNGRMARCVQSFVLARDGVLAPEFMSIEEYLGRNTPAYYAVLTDVAAGSWSPERSARPWLTYCLTAHYRQAKTVLQRIDEAAALWDQVDELVRLHGLPDRSIGVLSDCARGWQTRRSLYVKAVLATVGEEIAEDTATRDLRALSGAGLLVAEGEKRGRRYRGSPELKALWAEIRRLRPAKDDDDPYELAQLRLPGV